MQFTALHEQACSSKPIDSHQPDISVIIPAYRGILTIGECLRSVKKAAESWSHEIIVVESSGDGTVEVVNAHFPEVMVIASPVRLSAGRARNEGMRRARGKRLLCVDQDCVVPDDWIERLVALLDQPGTGAAGGSIAVANPRVLSGWCVYFLEFLHHFPSRGPLRDNNFLIGANSAWHPEAVEVAPFPDQTLGEDLLISEDLRRRGYVVRYDPTITVAHHNREGWAEFMRYCRAMGEAAAKDQLRLGGRAIAMLRRLPILCFGIPLVMLPRIGWRLLGAPRGYLWRFLMLFPCCAWGQIIWAASFRRSLIQTQTRSSAVS